jgi:carbamoyltransferase
LITVQSLQAGDVAAAADIHLKYMSGRLSGGPGRRLLRRYYGALALRRDGVCLVARDSENHTICGLAVVIWARHPLWSRLFARDPFGMSWWLTMNFLVDPRKLASLPRLLWEKWPVKPLRRKAGPAAAHGCILQTLISTAAGKGIGADLATAAKDWARERGFRYMFVPTEEANLAANRVYHKCGFQLLMTASELGKRVNWYGYQLEGPAQPHPAPEPNGHSVYILGINAYHAGASACLIKDGQLVAAVEEERFNRIKYAAGFPVESIRYCLEKAGISAYDLNHIGISKDPSVNLYKKILFAVRHRPSFELIKDRLAGMGKVYDIKKTFCETLGVEAGAMRADFHDVEHHRAHLASAFFVSPFQEAALLSVDGFGDFVSTMTGRGSGNKIQVLDTVTYPHSLGAFFTGGTQWLGFPKFGDEGKVQGLAAYGQPVYLDRLREILRLKPSGRFDLNLDYFVYWNEGVDMTWEGSSPALETMYSAKFVDEFGPPRQPRGEITSVYADMAASLQAMLEEAEFHVVRNLQRATGLEALCMAGGVALNSTFNGKVLPQTPFKDIFVQPAANDAGTALGVAYYIYHQLLGMPRCFVMDRAYTGPCFANGRIESALRTRNLSYETLEYDEMTRRVAQLLAEGKVVGWFQGDLEWGPRALGNRSILADPRREDMKDILNARVKHREKFRPFAPSVLLESVGDYFDQTYPDPFMIKVYNVLERKRKEIPAVTHVDGTGRLQTVGKEQNPLYWQLIKEFENVTGIPVVLNTSFNENEPIVCRPEEAIECFLRTRMDALAVGNYLVSKDG